MKTVAFFNNKGGVGKTTLVYHLAWMFSDMGIRVLAADLDPQANLTAMTLTDEQLYFLEDGAIKTIYDVVAPLIAHGTEVEPHVVRVAENFGLILGDLQLSGVEDALSGEWTKCLADSVIDRERAFKVTTSLAKAVQRGANQIEADVALVDIGPNLGAINRCALLGADYVVVPVAPDLFSLKGLSNVGLGLGQWNKGWHRRLDDAPQAGKPWPQGQMQSAGYVISRFSTYAGEKATHFRRWIDRVPRAYHHHILRETDPVAVDVNSDPACLAWLKDYRSLVPMAQEARKPIFALKPADGAIGAHQSAVRSAYAEFRKLAERIAAETGIALYEPFRSFG